MNFDTSGTVPFVPLPVTSLANMDFPTAAPDNFINNEAGLFGSSLSDFWARAMTGVPGPDETAAAFAQVKKDTIRAGGTQDQAEASTAAMADQLAQSAASNPTNISNLLRGDAGGPSVAQLAVGFLLLGSVAVVLSIFKGH